MIRVLFIEISAFHTFAWAEDVAVRHRPRAPATARPPTSCRTSAPTRRPHVDYLKTALDRDARPHLGRHERPEATTAPSMIGTLWDAGLDQSLGAGRERRPARRSSARSSTGCLRHDERQPTSSPSSTRGSPSADGEAA